MNPSQFGPNFNRLDATKFAKTEKKSADQQAPVNEAAVNTVSSAPINPVAAHSQDALANYGKANVNVSPDSVMSSSTRHAIKQLDGVLAKITSYIASEFPDLSAGAQQQLALATVHQHLNRS